MKIFRLLSILLLSIAGQTAFAQDIIVIKEGEFIRGTIKATNFSTVVLKNDDGSIVQYEAKNIKEFVWNGETYVSKPIVVSKRMEFRFFRLLEEGAVNLYSIGGITMAEEPQPKRAKVRPSIAVGGGTGGLGGGVGAGISFGSGRSNAEQPKRILPTTYFIEKLGTGPLLELPIEGPDAPGKTQHIKNLLLQKMTGDTDIATRINAADLFSAALVRQMVVDYNQAAKK